MSQRWRVGESGLRVITTRGTYSLPAGALLDELPERYEGGVELVDDEFQPAGKRLGGYDNKMLRPAEDK